MDFLDDLNPVIVAAVIALSGTALTVIITYGMNKRTLKHELNKLKSTIEQSFTSKILDERQKRYPEVYKEISLLAKHMKANQDKYTVPGYSLTLDVLNESFLQIEKLDSQHGLFYSIQTADCMAAFRDQIYRCITFLKNDKLELPFEMIDKLRDAASIAEIALKKDIGILIDEFLSIRMEHAEKDYKEILDKTK